MGPTEIGDPSEAHIFFLKVKGKDAHAYVAKCLPDNQLPIKPAKIPGDKVLVGEVIDSKGKKK